MGIAKVQEESGDSVPAASDSVAGIAKLYDDLLASNTDGAVTQNAVGLALALLQIALDAHINDTNDPHNVTKTQVGLGNVPNLDTSNADNITSGILNVARLSASDLRTLLTLPVVIIAQADVPNATTTPIDCGLNFAAIDGEKYFFEAFVSHTVNTAGTGSRFVMDGSGTFQFDTELPTTTGSKAFANSNTASDTPAAVSANTANAQGICVIRGFFTASGSGDLKVQFAPEAGGSATVLTGSILRVTRVI